MNLRPLLVLPPVLLGVLGFIWMTSRPDPEVSTPPEAALAVRVQAVSPRTIIATAEGFGRVEAEHSWAAIAEVQGRVTGVLPGLNTGSIVEAGTVLVEIDQTDNELSRQKTLANIAAVEADLAELSRQEENSKRLLLVEQRILKVAEAELARIQSLLERGAGTQANVDTAEKAFLAQQSSVTSLTNTLALFPAQSDALRATLAVRQSELAEAERALEKSTIVAPFRGRVASMDAEVGQFVGTGDNLLSLDSTAAAEVTAEIQPSSFGPIVYSSFASSFLQDGSFDTSQFIAALKQAGVSARVELSNTEAFAAWEAEIVRLRGTMDSETGTMGIVVTVADPLVLRPGVRRPPLHTGSFVRVVFSSKPRADSIAVPRHALHMSDQGDPFVYLADSNARLEIRKVEPGQIIGSEVIVTAGLDGSETLVLGQPSPPVVGMKLVLIPVAPLGEGH
jgi:RND family efflux transporter MFP subunit